MEAEILVVPVGFKCTDKYCAADSEEMTHMLKATKASFTSHSVFSIAAGAEYKKITCPFCCKSVEATGQVTIIEEGIIGRTDKWSEFKNGWYVRFDELHVESHHAYTRSEHLTGIIRFAIRHTNDSSTTGYKYFKCAVRLPYGKKHSFKSRGAIEIVLPEQLRRVVNYTEFSAAAERYFYLMIGSNAIGLRVEQSRTTTLKGSASKVDYQCALIHAVPGASGW